MAVDGAQLAAEVQKYLGVAYKWGGNSLTTGIDCSGLLQQVYAKYGITVPRVTYEQINSGSKIAYEDIQAGDMVFFDTDPSKAGPDHVGMYIGDGKFVHAPRPGDVVKVSSMNDGYYSTRYMAARRPTGMVGGGTDSPNAATNTPVQPRLEPEELAASYGWAYGFLNSVPELKGLFTQAVAETWNAQHFTAKLKETDWWKTNSAAQREAALLASTDPATYAAKVNAARMLVRQKANDMGAILTDGIADRIGEDFVRMGMQEAELNSALAGYINFTAEGVLGGQAGIAEIRLKQLARVNGVDLSKEATRSFAQQIAMGASTMEQAEGYVRNLAKSMFPTYAEQIDAGVNMSEVAMPYMQMVSEELQVAPGDLDLKNPLVRQGLAGLDLDGKPFGMALNDFQRYVRQQPQWLRTDGARNNLMNVGNEVLKSMGLLA